MVVLVQGHMLSRPNRRLQSGERKGQSSDAQICGSREKRFVKRRNMLGEGVYKDTTGVVGGEGLGEPRG